MLTYNVTLKKHCFLHLMVGVYTDFKLRSRICGPLLTTQKDNTLKLRGLSLKTTLSTGVHKLQSTAFMKLKLSHNVFAYCFIQYLLNNTFGLKFQGEITL